MLLDFYRKHPLVRVIRVSGVEGNVAPRDISFSCVVGPVTLPLYPLLHPLDTHIETGSIYHVFVRRSSLFQVL